jgi:hypothetical protein
LVLKRWVVVAMGSVAALAASLSVGQALAPHAAQAAQGGKDHPPILDISNAVASDVSAPLTSLTAAPTTPDSKKEKDNKLLPTGTTANNQDDSAVQSSTGAAVATTAELNFAGVGNGDYGFSPDAAPPDTNGAVGATQYVQWVNEKFAVFNKSTGALVYGPAAGNTLWSGFGGGCQNNNDGDPSRSTTKRPTAGC